MSTFFYRSFMDLKSSVTEIKGIGEKYTKYLEKLGIYTVEDLLMHIPRDYRDFRKINKISQAKAGEYVFLEVSLCTEPVTVTIKNGMKKTSFYVGDDSDTILVVYFNQVYIRQHIKRYDKFYIYGKIDDKYKTKSITSPQIFFQRPYDFMPIYGLTSGITQSFLRKAIDSVLKSLEISESYSAEFLYKYSLMPLRNAFKLIHRPTDISLAKKARERLVLDEFMAFNTALEMIDRANIVKSDINIKCDGFYGLFCKKLSFEPTSAQKRVMKDIETDLSGDKYMNRLVQGDVGCGKTIIAFYAMYLAYKNGYQSALMAPTEVLAKQHYDEAVKLFGEENIVLITGSMKAAEKRNALNKIKQGEVSFIIGTHALIFDSVEFLKLGLIITDEQHKFGVEQRARLAKKKDVHTLIMSATPIPRSLLMVLYGRSDISVVDEMPAGRQKISTYIIRKNKYEDMLGFIKNELDKKNQAYIVCPIIDDTEDGSMRSASQIKKEFDIIFKNYNVDMLHGKMKSKDKEQVMQRFSEGKTDLIVSTTVIEVGVNVPRATVMCIMNAERFGLSQLHQLRGRVGRGSEKSYCFLVSDNANSYERLSVLTGTDDGFLIAQKDMEMRGGGDIFGKRQHGEAIFNIGNLIGDGNLLERAKRIIEEIKDSDEFKDDYEKIKKNALKYYHNDSVDIAFN